MAGRGKLNRKNESNVKLVRNALLWVVAGMALLWVFVSKAAARDVATGFFGLGIWVAGPFMMLTGFLRLRLSCQREATTWRNRLIVSTPLFSVLASAPSMSPDGASTLGGLLGDLAPMVLSIAIGDLSYWLCFGLALFALFWILIRPALKLRVFSFTGVNQVLSDAFGAIANSERSEKSSSSKVERLRQLFSAENDAAGQPGQGAGFPGADFKSKQQDTHVDEKFGSSISSLNDSRLSEPLANEEIEFEPLPAPPLDRPLCLAEMGEVENEQPPEQVNRQELMLLTTTIKNTVRDISKAHLEEVADPVIGMSTIRFEFSKSTRDISVKKLEGLSEDIAVATGREGVRITISPSIIIELSLQENERRFSPILPLLLEVVEVKTEAPPLYLIGRTQERVPYQLDANSSVHMLVAGTSGGGKSVLLHSIVWGLIFRYPPSVVRIAFYDHKAVEFSRYRGLPHLWQDIVTSEAGFYRLLENLKIELARRKKTLRSNPDATFTWLMIVMDEFRGLTNGDFIHLVSEARAFQIRFILGTQRADKESVDTRIKSNLVTNIALKTRNHTDSNMIIGTSDAQHLLLKGDCIVRCGNGEETRVQAGWVTNEDLSSLSRLFQ